MEVISYLLGKKAGGGSSPVLQEKNITITENGTETITADTGYDGLSSVNVDTNVPSSGGAIKESDVNFYDYDGTLTNSYTKNEFLALSQMPENPTHQGLTSQGWNWSLSDAQDYVNDYGILDIGQMYVTDDGYTRIYITLNEGRTNPYLGFAVNGTVTVDWGDGSTEQITGTSTTSVVNTMHEYANAGDYIIKIHNESTIYLIGDGSYGISTLIWGNNVSTSSISRYYLMCVNKIELGSNCVIMSRAFGYMSNLQSITMPRGSVNGGTYGSCFTYTTRIKHITIPSSDSPFSLNGNMFENSYARTISIPNNITNIGAGCFTGDTMLIRICIPKTVTINVSLGSNMPSLKEVVIPKISTFAYGFLTSCNSLIKLLIGNLTTTITSIGGNSFQRCQSLRYIDIPSTITSLGTGAFDGCYSLQSIDIPSGVTSIPTNCFQSCYSLTHIDIPSTVTSIGTYAFYTCSSMKYMDFSEHSSIPTLANTNAFNSVPSDCKIIVPDALYETWIAANNWSTYASRIIKKSDWDNL